MTGAAPPDPHAPPSSRAALVAARGTALLLVLLGLFPLANRLSDGEAIPWWSTALGQWAAWAVLLGGVALALVSIAPRAVTGSLAALDGAILRPRAGVFAAVAGTTTALVALRAGWVLFQLQPVTSDEFAQQWQARLLSLGKLAARGEPAPEFFSTLMTVDAGHGWLAQFPVGGPAIIALGMLAGVAWLIGPLLTGWTVAAFYLFARAVTDDLSARRAALVATTAPFVLFMGGSQMNHVPTLAAVVTALLALTRWTHASDARSGAWPAATIGLALGIAATVRPYDAALGGLAVGLFQLHAMRGASWRWRTIAIQCVAALVPVLALLAVNEATLGSPFAFGYDVLNGAEHRPGFHAAPTGEAHTPVRGLVLVSSYLLRLNVDMLGWPVPALLLVASSLLLRRHYSRWDLLLALLVATTLAGYFAYWAESYFVGPRFLYATLPAFLLWIGQLPQVVSTRLRSPRAARTVGLLIPLWILIAWSLPANRANHYGVRTLARHFGGKASTSPLIVREVERRQLDNALVLVADGWHARLAARLRAAGFRPLFAERLVMGTDACALHVALDSLERAPLAPQARAQAILTAASRAPAMPREGQAPMDLLAFSDTLIPTAACLHEAQSIASNGVSLGALLPHQSLDASGALGGPVVYARDMGERNERLRTRFGARRWYRARVEVRDGEPRALIEPYPGRRDLND